LRLTFGGKRRFFVRDEGIAKQFQQPQKCGGTKTCRGRSPNTFLWSLAAVRRRTFTALLNDACPTK